MSEWIKCSEQLPENGGYYLAYGKDKYGYNTTPVIVMAEFFKEHMYGDNYWRPDVSYVSGHDYEVEEMIITHWQPLPDPPKV